MARSSRSPDSSRRRRRSRSSSSVNSTSSDDYRHSGSKKKRSKRSRSRSKTRSKDSSRSKSKGSSRSSSQDRRRRHHRREVSRSRSRSRGRSSNSPSVLQARSSMNKKELRTLSDKVKSATSDSSHGSNSLALGNMTPEEQLKTKMQMALKAAAEADAQLREKGVLTSSRNNPIKDSNSTNESNALSIQEQINRCQAIDTINSAGFTPQDFISNQSDKISHGSSGLGLNEVSAYESQQQTKISSNAVIDKLLQNELAHENLFANKEQRQEKWVRRLYTMRQKRLNGDIMS